MVDIELRDITKRFGPVVANANINLKIRGGEILGLLGENGAGKTTLMNVLSGLYEADEGEILIDGKPVVFDGPGDSIRAGIGMVHQHFMLVPVFSVAENVILGIEPTGFLNRLNITKANTEVREISEKYGLAVDPEAVVEQLPVGIQQRVEIIKVLFRSAEVLIFDEPTAVLTPQEANEFFEIMRALRDAGKALVFITHKLHEVLEVADRIDVLRDGKIVGEGDPKTTTDEDLATLMVGRPVNLSVDRTPANPGKPILEVSGLTVLNDKHDAAVNDVSFTTHEGEIVGIAGVQGNGQSELVEALTGLRHAVAGSIRYFEHDTTSASPRAIHKLGVGHIPEDRHRSGMIGGFTVTENMVLNTYYATPYSKGLSMNWRAAESATTQIMDDFDIRAASTESAADQLSGGNQQKMVVGREMSREIKFLVASQPTRGIDVGSIEYIHKRIVAARDSGHGILLISSELEEILTLSDRILVMYRGRIVAEFASGAQPNEIGLAMAGAVA